MFGGSNRYFGRILRVLDDRETTVESAYQIVFEPDSSRNLKIV